ncbi:pyruvate kinase-like protein [Xylariales sp. PMI_506]|nr:pyruvate kinase-like protein [Xylariales sp. PMI_506]
MAAIVAAVSKSPQHHFTKSPVHSITLVRERGVRGDAHFGPTVQHRSRLHIRPPPRNLRQVHLVDIEALDERGLVPGQIGENVATRGLRLLELPAGTRLRFVAGDGVEEIEGRSASPASEEDGDVACTEAEEHEDNYVGNKEFQVDETGEADVEAGGLQGGQPPTVIITGLRNPCPQIDKFQSGLRETFLVRDSERKIVGRLAGVMAVVEVGGTVVAGMSVLVEQPADRRPLEPV